MNLAELSQTENTGVSGGEVAARWGWPKPAPSLAQALPGQLAAASREADAQADAQSRAAALSRLGWRRAVAFALACLERARQRQRLMALDERMLKDVGLSRADATAEYQKPFWR